jgi:hypothetical protein
MGQTSTQVTQARLVGFLDAPQELPQSEVFADCGLKSAVSGQTCT